MLDYSVQLQNIILYHHKINGIFPYVVSFIILCFAETDGKSILELVHMRNVMPTDESESDEDEVTPKEVVTLEAKPSAEKGEGYKEDLTLPPKPSAEKTELMKPTLPPKSSAEQAEPAKPTMPPKPTAKKPKQQSQCLVQKG
jgi:hypothetical protein